MIGRPWRTVVIGFGKIADTLGDDPLMKKAFAYGTHAQVLSNHPRYDWQAVVDPSEEALDRARRRWNVPVAVRDIEELPKEIEPELAVITTPPGQRTGLFEKLPNLKAAMVEKPLGTNDDDVRAFATLCARREIRTQVNYWRRGDRQLRALAEGQLGDWIGRPQTAFGLYGNGFFNNGSHLVDLVRMLLGEVSTARATGTPSTAARGPLPSDLQIPFTLGLQNGATVAVHPLDFAPYREVGLDIWGSAGRLSIMQESVTIARYPLGDHSTMSGEREIRTDRPTLVESTISDALWHLYDNLARSLDDGTSLWSPLDSSVATDAVLESVLRSARDGGVPAAAHHA